MLYKFYGRWDDAPLDVKEKIMTVVSANKIDFRKNQVYGIRVNFWDYAGESNNGRMVDNGRVCRTTYRVADIGTSRVYITSMQRRKSILIDFYDKDANIGMTQSIFVDGGIYNI